MTHIIQAIMYIINCPTAKTLNFNLFTTVLTFSKLKNYCKLKKM